jgi:hypothetical protein
MVERDNLNITATKKALDEDRSAEEIRQDIAAKRESISETVDRLNDKFQSTLDWRTYAGNFPFVALGAALGLGYVVSRIFTPKPTPRERIMEAIADSVEDFKGQFGDYLDLDIVPRKRTTIGTSVKAAATAMLTKAATDYVKNVVTGSRLKASTAEEDGAPEKGRAAIH